jgi:hypothetical protein
MDTPKTVVVMDEGQEPEQGRVIVIMGDDRPKYEEMEKPPVPLCHALQHSFDPLKACCIHCGMTKPQYYADMMNAAPKAAELRVNDFKFDLVPSPEPDPKPSLDRYLYAGGNLYGFTNFPQPSSGDKPVIVDVEPMGVMVKDGIMVDAAWPAEPISFPQSRGRAREMFDRLPADAQDKVLSLMLRAMLWRGWAEAGRPHAMTACVQEIAGIFHQHGMSIEEYT